MGPKHVGANLDGWLTVHRSTTLVDANNILYYRNDHINLAII